MIQVTLTFVSVDALIGALREIPENALAGTPSTVALVASTQKDAAAPVEKPKKEKSTPAATPAAAAPSQPIAGVAAETAAPEKTAAESSPTAEPVADAAPVSTAAIEYSTLQKAVFALAGKSRDAASAVVASFGVKTFKDLDASRWGEALAAVQAKAAELEASQ